MISYSFEITSTQIIISAISQIDIDMFWKQNRRHRIVSETTCPDIIAGNKNVTSESEQFMKRNPRPILSDHIYANLTQNCTDFKSRRGYIMKTLSEESAAFPLAYSILFYKDLMQVERLLRAIYRPNNIYCLHMDAYRYYTILSLHYSLIIFISLPINVKWSFVEYSLGHVRELFKILFCS